MSDSVRIREFLAEATKPPRAVDELDASFRLIESGGLDSLAILHLVSFLEDEFDIELTNDDLVLENFATVGDVVRLVESKAGHDG